MCPKTINALAAVIGSIDSGTSASARPRLLQKLPGGSGRSCARRNPSISVAITLAAPIRLTTPELSSAPAVCDAWCVVAKYQSSSGLMVSGSIRSKKPAICIFSGSHGGSSATAAAITTSAGNSATIAEYAAACATVNASCSTAAKNVRRSNRPKPAARRTGAITTRSIAA